MSAGMVVLAINLAGCSKIGGLVPGANGDQASAGATGSTAGPSTVAIVATPKPTAVTQARPGVTPPIAAHLGPIAQTLSLVGKVAAVQEVPLGFAERVNVKTVTAKPGQSVDVGQVLATADASDMQASLDAAQQRLEDDTTALGQAQAASARQAASAQQAQADRVASAQANLTAARAALQKVQAGASSADVQAAQNSVTAAQLAAHKAETDQATIQAGPDPSQVHAAEQELANAQAAYAQAQSDLAKMPGGQLPDDSGGAPSPSAPTQSAAPPAVMADNISPAGVSTDPGNPANNFGFQAIATDPQNPGTVYLGTCYQGLWKSTDGGNTWVKINTGTNGKALDSGRIWLVVLDPTDTHIIYAAPGYGVGGLWKSTDGGVNWTPLFPSNSQVVQDLGTVPTPSNLAIDPANHLHMIASSHFPWAGKYAAAAGVGVLETNDGGNTWTIHDPIPNSGAEHEVGLIDSSIWLESWSGATYRTTDHGTHWTKVIDTNGETQNLTIIDNLVYLPAPTGLMRSSDWGATWQTVGPGGMVVVSDGVNLYTQQSGPGGGHSEPIYYSPVADGTNWNAYSTQTMCTNGGCDGPGWAAYSSSNHTLYFSNWIGGVWRLKTSAVAAPAAAPAPVAIGKAGSVSQSDVIAARQRLVTAKDAVDAARAKLQALQNGPSQDSLDTAQLATTNAEAVLQAAQAHLNDLRRGPAPADLRAAQDAVSVAQTALDHAQSNANDGQDQDSGDVVARKKAIDKDNADIAKLQDRIAATRITAPFAGTVVSVRIRVGDTVDDTQAAITMAQPGSPLVRTTITPADFDKVSVGQVAIIQLPGQTDDSAGLSGKVTQLTANDAGTAKIATVDVDWGDAPPKLGTVMNVGVVLQQKDSAVLVPKKAVHTIGTQSFVELMDGNRRKIANVQVGIVGNNDAEIVSGLSVGQLVAVGP